MAAEDVEFAGLVSFATLWGYWEGLWGERIDYLPHNAEYLTLIMTSVGSMIFGIGRSSILTSSFPLNTTAFIVVFDILDFFYVDNTIDCLIMKRQKPLGENRGYKGEINTSGENIGFGNSRSAV